MPIAFGASMPQLRIVALLASVCLLYQTGTHAAGPDRPHLDSATRAARDHNASSRIIVRYKSDTGRRPRALTASAQKLRALVDDPDVASISADAVIHAHGAAQSLRGRTPLALDTQQLRRTLGLSAFPSGGRGVGVAVIDSGMAPVPDIADRITAFYDFTDGGRRALPSDDYGHGTHVAGLIAGSGILSLGGHAGIAPEARLIGLKVLDANGAGYTSDVIAAVEFAIANKKSLGIDIINLSLGHPILEPAATDPLVQAVEQAAAAGIIVVTSAGNSGASRITGRTGFGGISSPGNAPSALTVGAFETHGTVERDDDTVASFSSRGPTWFDGTIKPDVLAPGVELIAPSHASSTLSRRFKSTAHYLSLSGTSMASAVATGVVALMIEANRLDTGNTRLTPNTVKMLLQYAALPVSGAHEAVELIEGAGGINAAGAIELAGAIDPSAKIGSYWLEHGVTPASRIGSLTLAWTRRVTWGDRLVAGDVLTRKEPAWSAKAVWGTLLAWTPNSWLTASTVLEHFDTWSAEVVRSAQPVKAQDDHVVWGNGEEDSTLRGTCASAADDHVVWGNCGDHVVWGNTVANGSGIK